MLCETLAICKQATYRATWSLLLCSRASKASSRPSRESPRAPMVWSLQLDAHRRERANSFTFLAKLFIVI